MVNLSQIFNWFKTGAIPTAQQFKDTFSSFWHKSEKIPQSQIFGLQEIIESATQGLIWQNPVANVEDLDAIYPNAQKFWAAMVTSAGYIYSFNGMDWKNTGLTAFPANVATQVDIVKVFNEMDFKAESRGIKNFDFAITDEKGEAVISVKDKELIGLSVLKNIPAMDSNIFAICDENGYCISLFKNNAWSFYGETPYKKSKNYGKSVGVFGGSLSVSSESEAAKKIWRDLLDLKITDYGVGGAGFSSIQGDSVQNQVNRAGVHDIYILWASTNDFTNSRELGNYNDYTASDGFDNTNRTSQCGGINYSIKKLMDKNPNAEIYFFTSLRFFYQDAGCNPFSQETNGIGRKFYEYVEMQKKCCERFGISLLDQFNIQGITEYNYSLFYNSDKLHMNQNGYKRIGYAQADFLANGI